MSKTTTRDDDGEAEGTTGRSGDRPKSTDGGSPSVTTRGDDRKSLLDKWGQRAAHVLLVIIPTALVVGVVLQNAGVHQRSMEFAQAFVGLVVTITGLLAVVVVLYESIKKSRQTELSEYETYK